jgi:hypothetical protein
MSMVRPARAFGERLSFQEVVNVFIGDAIAVLVWSLRRERFNICRGHFHDESPSFSLLSTVEWSASRSVNALSIVFF